MNKTALNKEINECALINTRLMRSHLRSACNPPREFVKSTAHSDTRQTVGVSVRVRSLDLHLKSILHHHSLNWTSV